MSKGDKGILLQCKGRQNSLEKQGRGFEGGSFRRQGGMGVDMMRSEGTRRREKNLAGIIANLQPHMLFFMVGHCALDIIQPLQKYHILDKT